MPPLNLYVASLKINLLPRSIASLCISECAKDKCNTQTVASVAHAHMHQSGDALMAATTARTMNDLIAVVIKLPLINVTFL